MTQKTRIEPLPAWVTRGRIREGRAWFDSVDADLDAQHLEVAPAMRARVFSDKALLDGYLGGVDTLDQAQQALAIARELDEPALLARALTACGSSPPTRAITSRWRGHASPRRSAWPVPWTIGGG